MRMTFYGITKHIVSYCETRAKQCRNASTDAPSEYERGRQYGRSEAFESVGAAIRENLAHEAWLLLFKHNGDEPKADIDEPLTKNNPSPLDASENRGGERSRSWRNRKWR